MTELLLILRQSGLLLIDLLPWILAGCVAGALLRTVRRLPFEKKLAASGPWAIPLAAVSGAASPLCTLGSVPVISGLTAKGLPRAAGFAFLASSSMVTPQIVLLTAGILGIKTALLQAVGGILGGIVTGGILSLVPKDSPLFRPGEPGTTGVEASSRTFWTHLTGQLEFTLFWLVAGVLFSQAAAVLVPPEWSGRLPGAGWGGVIAGAILSGPLYSCGGAVLPALSLLRENGIGNGFLLAFLICGPATRLRSAAALGRLITPVGMVLYFGIILVFSVLYGRLVGGV